MDPALAMASSLRGSDADRCGFFIKRRRRFCALRAMGDRRLCPLHSKEQLECSRARSLVAQTQKGCASTTDVALETKVGSAKGDNGRLKNRVSAPKRMTNPHSFPCPPPLPNWRCVYSHPMRSLFIDIGSARGRYLLGLHRDQMDCRSSDGPFNYLGLEIRPCLVREASLECEKDISNAKIRGRGDPTCSLFFLQCNANVTMKSLFASFEGVCGPVQRISVLFPDPWMKRKHYNRRVLSATMLRDFAAGLAPGSGEMYALVCRAVCLLLLNGRYCVVL